ncbi:MAG TPA: fumarylacetoacetate hydrolase family protein [Chitinophaga sp.]|uniref:fumarylacetoacetate hydrolase family protein n=1 Tax=Chitinophaga sp. TaxID=1869181 RepID=UPI002CBCE45F|nr:fumarylacetoacetate hydrolase family protein [Chitinophaga sp.]HVI45731.1 fumarylacetoacetate hydrolase family protein [Chitinophaga sp.]
MNHIKLYRTRKGIFAEYQQQWYHISVEWDELVNRQPLFSALRALLADVLSQPDIASIVRGDLLPPIGSQEVWAAGVTYQRSKVARMEESEMSGAAACYDKVYMAERPELFFKATPQRTVGHGDEIYIRRDSDWNVPEPELTLFVNREGNISGYTIGNDMSSRSIEGENPLYLPQAKTYERCAAIGPCLLVTELPIPSDTLIQMKIYRNGAMLFHDHISISQMKRTHTELVEYLYRGCRFLHGCYLMTGTCLVPGNGFTLQENDLVEIAIDHIGVLLNTVKAGV